MLTLTFVQGISVKIVIMIVYMLHDKNIMQYKSIVRFSLNDTELCLALGYTRIMKSQVHIVYECQQQQILPLFPK